MRISDISNAHRLTTKLTSLKERQSEWRSVSLIDSTVARRIHANGSSPDRLPMLDDDTGMHVALVEAIIAEYNKRIETIEADLKELGVTL